MNSGLQNDWERLGEGSFEFEVLERCAVSKLTEREQAHMDEYKLKYNVTDAALSHVGAKRSPEARARLSAALQKRMKDPDVRAALLAAAQRRKERGGYEITEECRAKLRAAKLGTTHNYGSKIGDALRGRTHSHGHKISATKQAKRAKRLAP